MAFSKKSEFQGHQIKISVIAKALSHPARVAILELLANRGKLMCNDIVQSLPLSQSTVSQHLKELKLAGLINGEIDGPRVHYSVDSEQLKLSKIHIEKFLSDIARS
jgi:DNA-binding transcriptional ArsR family regulator